MVNASKPPGVWQTYDIIFESPRWNEQGELLKKAVITVLYNGVVIHNRYEILGNTRWKTLAAYGRPHPPEVFIQLQDHNDPVRYRNVWIRSLRMNDTE